MTNLASLASSNTTVVVNRCSIFGVPCTMVNAKAGVGRLDDWPLEGDVPLPMDV